MAAITFALGALIAACLVVLNVWDPGWPGRILAMLALLLCAFVFLGALAGALMRRSSPDEEIMGAIVGTVGWMLGFATAYTVLYH